MFIEAGDVTHRRRGQNRNEGLSKNFQVFYTKFFGPKFVYFDIFRPEMMKIKFFGKIKILTPLNFEPPPNFWTLEDLLTLHPYTKFGEILSKGVGARRDKASKTDLWPEGTILTRRGRHLQGWCAIPLRTYPESFKSFRRILR